MHVNTLWVALIRVVDCLSRIVRVIYLRGVRVFFRTACKKSAAYV